jgi:hypothetical protein
VACVHRRETEHVPKKRSISLFILAVYDDVRAGDQANSVIGFSITALKAASS